MTAEKLEIIITNNFCWCCGSPLSRTGVKVYTQHHAIPRRFRPIRNMIIPVCEFCHNKINSVDINGITELLKANMTRMKSVMQKYEIVVKRLKQLEKEEK